MRVQVRTSLVVFVVLLLGLPGAARASSDDVIRDCAQDGKLDKPYTQKELRDAERNLPSDLDEYTDCRQVIRSAMSGGSGSPGIPAGGGIITASGAVAGTEEDVAALTALEKKIAKGNAPAVTIGSEKVTPGNAGLGGVLGGLAGANGMPLALIVAMVALMVLAVVVGYLALLEKVPFVRDLTSRVFSR
jgi:hypothetical protein